MFIDSFTFQDFLIQPKSRSRVKSRSQVDTSIKIGNLELNMPVVSASMSAFDTINPFSAEIDVNFAKALSNAGGMHILSRSATFSNRFDAVQKLIENDYKVGMAVSLSEFNENRYLLENTPAVISIDIANGAIIDDIEWESNWPLVVGNFATPSVTTEVQRFRGNVIIKLGVGSGSACSTRVVTGVGYPQAGLVYDASRVSKLPIISDGGVSSVSDFTKAIALGADIVMTGRLFAAAKETPWPTQVINGDFFKPYRGMASREEKKTKKFVEGASGYVPYEEKTVQEIMYDLKDGLTSAMSYCDSFDLQEFQYNASFVSSSSHHLESSVRLKQI